MIKRLKYSEIDFQKYSACIANSVQSNFYARKEVLDFLSGDWELLIYNDYDFVMPLPLRRKFGFQVVIMPLFCQQLGIFGKEDNTEINQKFADYLQKNYAVYNYSFNAFNRFQQNFSLKKNYLIEKGDYHLNRKRYFKGRKSTVKSAQHLVFKELVLDDGLRTFIRKNFKGLEKPSDLQKFLNYLDLLMTQQKLRIFCSFCGTDLTNVALTIDSGSSLSLLGLINSEEFRRENGPSFLIDRILQEFLSQRNFDFMGGNLRGIEIFFKSFGAEVSEYAVLTPSKINLMKNLLRRRQ